MMPYASALFSRRVVQDRPLVIPKGACNFAFLGQFVELPEDTVFTVEYSVHSAMHAVYNLLHVDKPIPPCITASWIPRWDCKPWNRHSSGAATANVRTPLTPATAGRPPLICDAGNLRNLE